MDVEDLYHVNFEQLPRMSCNQKFTGFDAELINKAENLSSKLTDLFRYSSPDEDARSVSRIITTTGLNIDRMNSVTQPWGYASKQESLPEKYEKNNLIFLDKKYFKFGIEDDGDEHSNAAIESEEAGNLNRYSTVFDEPESSNVLNAKSTTSHPATTKKVQEKRKKRHKRIKAPVVNEQLCSTKDTDIPKNLLGAPPGAGSTSLRNVRQEFSLTKNSNYSLQFRL